MAKCDYYGCQEEQQSVEYESGMKFCKHHNDIIEKLIEKEDALGIIQFWIKAQGGSQKAARRMVGE
jgi:hypothetical protein